MHRSGQGCPHLSHLTALYLAFGIHDRLCLDSHRLGQLPAPSYPICNTHSLSLGSTISHGVNPMVLASLTFEASIPFWLHLHSSCKGLSGLLLEEVQHWFLRSLMQASFTYHPCIFHVCKTRACT